MEDKELEQEVLEDENLNQEQEIEDDENQEPKTYTREEVEEMRKKLQSDSEKWVQKVIKERKLFERAYKELPKISQDDARLVEIYEEDPELAQRILEDHFDGVSIEEYKESIDYKEDYSDPAKMEAKIKREAEKIARNKEVESEKKAFISKLQMTDEEKEVFESELSDLLTLKKYQTQDITKVMERAYKLSADEESIKKLKNAEVIARTQSSTKWGSAKWEGNKDAQVKKEIADFKKKFNL